MSVLMTMRVQGDPKRLEAEDPTVLKSIVDRAREFGVVSHRFYGTDDEILVVDEWPDEGAFQKFFAASPEIADVMERAGVTAEPQIRFYRELDTSDAMG